MVKKDMLPFLILKEDHTACLHPPKPEDLEAVHVTPRSTTHHAYKDSDVPFNSLEFWKVYRKDKSMMVHFNHSEYPGFTAMAITAVKPDGTLGPSYVQLGASSEWTRVEGWRVEKGRLRVYTSSGSYVVGFNAKPHAFHDF
jgi:hypothetical protein